MNSKIIVICLIIGSINTDFLLGQSIIWTKDTISTSISSVKKNVVADIDLDGHLDIVVTANPEGSGSENDTEENVMWFENNGSEQFTKHDIDLEFVGARGLAVGDLNGDGWPDVVAGSRRNSAIVWYANDETQDWTKTSLFGDLAPNNYQIVLVDLDNDGELDIVDGIGDDADNGSSVTDQIRWLENDGSATSFTENTLATYPTPAGIAIGHFNGDSDLDVAAAAWTDYGSLTPVTAEDVRWWSGPSFTQQQVIQQTYGANDLVAFDIDKNNTLDLIGAGYKTSSIDWWSNNGSGVFSSINSIGTNFNYTRNVNVVDVDGDGDWDVVAAADTDGDISWFENDGSEGFTEWPVSTSFAYAYFVSSADMDGDGDMDIVGTAQNANQLAWWENDLAEEILITGTNPGIESYYSGDVTIDFANEFSEGNTSVFFNQGDVPNKNLLGTGVDHVAQKGFYTITTAAITYDATIVFSYAGITGWSPINDENDLIIVYFDPASGSNGQWVIANGSSVTAGSDIITVSGLSTELAKYSIFTIASSTTDNSLPVELVSFDGMVSDFGIELNWLTESEINNIGFELWRKSSIDTSFRLLSSYDENDDLAGLGTSSSGKNYNYEDYSVEKGRRYTYQLVDVTYDGKRFTHSEIKIDYVTDGLVRVVNGITPDKLQLQQNYPNPFNPTTRIHFSIPLEESGNTVSLTIYNQLGQKVKTLFNSAVAEGNYSLVWNGTNDQNQFVSSGMYIYLLHLQNNSIIKRMTLLK